MWLQLRQKDKLINCQILLNQQEDAVVSEIHSVLCNFVTSSPEAWAPIISSWSLQLLGQVSSHYSQLPSSVGLNEALHWWMSCRAARTLVDITTQCLSCLIDSDTETCINSLLDTSVAHSPHFDWVVAHVGSSFPKTVITRVLSCGLKDFCAKKKLPNSSKSAKLNSVVGILGHLASSHFSNIRKALLELFEWTLQDPKDDVHRSAVIPFLLELASKSQVLLKALSTDVLHTLDMKTLSTLAEFAPKWTAYFKNDTEKLEDLIIHLALGCEKGGAKIISLLLDGTSYPDPNISDRAIVLLELLLEDIDVQLRSYKSTTIPFLESIKSEMRQVQHLLLSDNSLKQQTACRLFKLMGSVNPSVIVELSSYLLVRGTTNAHRATLLELIKSNCESNIVEEKNLLALALEEALRLTSGQLTEVTYESSAVECHLLWQNVAHLIRYELSSESTEPAEHVVCKAVVQNLFPLSDLLSSCYDSETLHAITTVIELLPLSSTSSLPLQLMLRLTKNCVKYFFVCVNEKDRAKKCINCNRACNLLSKLCCRSPAARSLALRDLLESSLFLSASCLFGAPKKEPLKESKQGCLLMEQNYRLGTTTILAQRQSSVFGNGAVGKVKKDEIVNPGLEEDIINENTMYLINAIRACCLDNTKINSDVKSSFSLDAVIQVSLLMVELISPDVMYNGLPWPEEEFCKVTIERDVHIRKIFDELPLAWKLLDFVAWNQPALCYCSVLLRALAATLKSQWSSTSTSDSPAVQWATVRLLEIMSLGQLLPSPLSSLQVAIPYLTAAEVVTLLQDCVWSYMRDNVPSPALFTRDPRSGIMWRDPNVEKPSTQYTETFRLILQNNIVRFGQLYAKLFIHQ
ncbi:hypothetical protein RUM44_013408 [Polyplax serrata]|uniref:Integrator complex subunit 5 n=1 Tax=Polyplax serrata TaxID=468196 RepID=A0ABR1BIT3_POLSC